MKRVCLALISGLAATTASAQPFIFSGIDPGTDYLDPRPNSTAAAASFDAQAGALGALNLITFESFAIGQFNSLTLAPGVVVAQVNYDLGLGGIVTRGYATPVGAATGFNTTPGGEKFLGFVPAFGPTNASLQFQFSTPIQAWGAYVVGLEPTVAGSVFVQFNDGNYQWLALPEAAGGGAQFFGFTDPGRLISSIALIEAQLGPTRDIYGVDDMRYVLVPEPGTLSLFGLGLLGFLRFRKR